MEYTLIRAKRKTLSLSVNSQGELIVRAPVQCSRDDIARFILSKSGWIERQKQRINQIQNALIPLSIEDIQSLTKKAKEAIPERVRYFSEIMKVDYGKINIKCQRTRWGSCSSKGNLNFNCLLMMCHESCLDYVVVHELAHRIHMDHSRAFWDCVASVIPDYRLHRAWLKKYGPVLLQSIPNKKIE